MRSDEESSISSDREQMAELLSAVAVLADGELTFPPPFDLASSVALANNIDFGAIAQRLFDATASRDSRYQVTITELSPDASSPLSRTVVDTTVTSTRLLLVLLDAVADELEVRRQQ